MNNNLRDIKKATYQDIASIVFVVASVINIIASDKEKEYLLSGDINDKNVANNIYIIVLLILLCLYLYFIKANQEAYNNCSNNDREAFRVRLYGSIFFLIGALCFLYFRISDKNSVQSGVEI